MERTITIRVSDDLKRELEGISKREERPISDIVRDSLKKYIAIRKFRRLRAMVLPFAEAQGILTDEDLFREIS